MAKKPAEVCGRQVEAVEGLSLRQAPGGLSECAPVRRIRDEL
jgi:hypothetical protein